MTQLSLLPHQTTPGNTTSTESSLPLLIVDGHNLLWGATFGFPAPIYSRDKTRKLTGLFAFFALLRKTIADELSDRPPEIIIVFDGEHGSDNRQADYDGYKANRDQNQAALEPLTYLADVKRALDLYTINWIEHPDKEADDIIATLTHQHRTNRPIMILSRDRDFYQLIDDTVTILNNRKPTGRRFITATDIIETYGVTPTQWADYRALTGDPADNIPGIKGIGAKSAAILLAGDHTLETIPADRTRTGRTKAVAEQLDQARNWRDLIRLDTTIDLSDTTITGKPSPLLPRPADVVEDLGLW